MADELNAKGAEGRMMPVTISSESDSSVSISVVRNSLSVILALFAVKSFGEHTA
jgi:hypothetical protein